MFKSILSVIFLTIVSTVVFSINSYAVENSGSLKEASDKRVIVRFKASAHAKGQSISAASSQSVLTSIGATRLEQYNFHTSVRKSQIALASGAALDAKTIEILELDGSVDVMTAIQVLRSSGLVEYAEPDYKVYPSSIPNDPRFDDLWGLHNTGDTDIDAPEAWDITTGTGDTVVGVLDTGLFYGHEDLVGNMWINPGEIAANGIDDDGNGVIDDIHGMDCADDDGDPGPEAYYSYGGGYNIPSHATHVAGTIAATGENNIGITGVNRHAKIMALRFMAPQDDGEVFGYNSDAIECLNYAINMKNNHGVNIRLTNNSWGGSSYSMALIDAIQATSNADMLFVVSAMNDSIDMDSVPGYPASYAIDNVISVASTNSRDRLSSFSNYGKYRVDLAAPGSDILSTVPGFDNDSGSLRSSYSYYSGTSMAAPHVAGAASLLWDNDQSLSLLAVKNLLLSQGDSLDILQDTTSTGKRLNVYNSLTCQPGNPRLEILTPGPGFVLITNTANTIRASLYDCGNPVTGVALTATPGNGDNAFELKDDGVFPDTESNDGVYSGEWNVVNESIETTLLVHGVDLTEDYPGATLDASGFDYVMDAEYSSDWIDATSGNRLDISSRDDAGEDVDIGFDFIFSGVRYTQVSVSTNGLIKLGHHQYQHDGANASIPSIAAPNGMFAVYWDDLNPSAAGDIYTLLQGDAPNRLFTVTWDQVPHFNSSDTATVQATMYEGSNDIVFRYLDVDFTGDSEFTYGNTATIGIEHQTGGAGLQYLYDGENQGEPVQIADGQAIRFSVPVVAENQSPVAAMQLSSSSGEAPFTVEFNASISTDSDGEVISYEWNFGDAATATGVSTSHTYTEVGEYTITLIVTDNDGATGQVSDTITVTAVPDTTAPIITLNGDETINLVVGDAYIELNATAEDDRDEVADVVISGEVDTSVAGTYIVSYIATDSSGNVGTTTRTVIVSEAPTEDNIAPVITLDGAAIIELTVGDTYVEQGATAEDDVDGVVAVIVAGDAVDTSTAGSYILTYTAVDAAGNESIITRTVNISDDAPPTGSNTVSPTDDANNRVDLGDTLAVSRWEHAFFRFDVSNIHGVIANATFRVYSQGDRAPLTLYVGGIENDEWSEETGTPGLTYYHNDSSLALDSVEMTEAGYIEFNVTDFIASQVAGDGYVTLEVSSNNGGWSRFLSSESEHPPELVIDISGPLPNQVPEAVANVVPNSGNAPLTVSFSASQSTDRDGIISSYAWDFGDGSSGSGETVSYTYNAIGQYNATLEVTDNDGATASTSILVVVTDPREVISRLIPTDDANNRVDLGDTLAVSRWEHAFFRFDVSNISGAVTNATFRVYYEGDRAPLNLYLGGVANDDWTESSGTPDINYNLHRDLSQQLDSLIAAETGYIEFTVTGYVAAQIATDGIVTLEIASDNGGWDGLFSRESDTAPELVIETQTNAVLAASTDASSIRNLPEKNANISGGGGSMGWIGLLVLGLVACPRIENLLRKRHFG